MHGQPVFPSENSHQDGGCISAFAVTACLPASLPPCLPDYWQLHSDVSGGQTCFCDCRLTFKHLHPINRHPRVAPLKIVSERSDQAGRAEVTRSEKRDGWRNAIAGDGAAASWFPQLLLQLLFQPLFQLLITMTEMMKFVDERPRSSFTSAFFIYSISLSPPPFLLSGAPTWRLAGAAKPSPLSPACQGESLVTKYAPLSRALCLASQYGAKCQDDGRRSGLQNWISQGPGPRETNIPACKNAMLDLDENSFRLPTVPGAWSLHIFDRAHKPTIGSDHFTLAAAIVPRISMIDRMIDFFPFFFGGVEREVAPQKRSQQGPNFETSRNPATWLFLS